MQMTAQYLQMRSHSTIVGIDNLSEEIFGLTDKHNFQTWDEDSSKDDNSKDGFLAQNYDYDSLQQRRRSQSNPWGHSP